MTDAEMSNDAYAVVLADLKAQREKLDHAISAIEALRGTGGSSSGPPRSPENKGLGAGAFLGMTIVDAAKKLLAHERRQLTNAEIVERLRDGGLVLNSADKLNTVGSVLNRRFMQVGDVVRVGRGTWGLKEWYPNRSFKTKAAEADQAPDPAPRPADDDLSDLGLDVPQFQREADDHGL